MEKKTEPIVIIGAGPAGLTAAYELAKRGREVLVYEKTHLGQIDKDGYAKLCGGGLVPFARNFLGDSEYFKENKDFIAKSGNLVANVKLNYSAVTTIDREDLARLMAQKAIRSGARIKFGTEVKEIDLKSKTIIAVAREKIAYSILIGADGANSLVKRSIGLKGSDQFLQAVEYTVSGESFSHLLTVDFNFDLFSGGYAWIFPHKRGVYIGACEPNLARRKKKSTLLEDLRKWAESEKVPLPDEKTIRHWIIPYGFCGFKFSGDIYLIGDAAGFTHGLLGEGVSSSFASGYDVARLITDAAYKPVNIARTLRIKRRQDWFLKAYCYTPALGRFLSKMLVWMASTRMFLPFSLWFCNLNEAKMIQNE